MHKSEEAGLWVIVPVIGALGLDAWPATLGLKYTSARVTLLTPVPHKYAVLRNEIRATRFSLNTRPGKQ
jgi:hypothetical protein